MMADGADLFATTSDGYSTLFIACQHSSVNVARLLVERAMHRAQELILMFHLR